MTSGTAERAREITEISLTAAHRLPRRLSDQRPRRLMIGQVQMIVVEATIQAN